MIPLSAIVDRLKGDSIIAGIAEERVYDHDPRRTTHPEMFDSYGYLLATLGVDDRGGVASFDAPAGAFQDSVQVWGFVPDTDAGRAHLKTLMQRVIVLLAGWREPITRARLGSKPFRLGDQASSIANGTMDYVRFPVVGVTIGVTD